MRKVVLPVLFVSVVGSISGSPKCFVHSGVALHLDEHFCQVGGRKDSDSVYYNSVCDGDTPFTVRVSAEDCEDQFGLLNAHAGKVGIPKVYFCGKICGSFVMLMEDIGTIISPSGSSTQYFSIADQVVKQFLDVGEFCTSNQLDFGSRLGVRDDGKLFVLSLNTSVISRDSLRTWVLLFAESFAGAGTMNFQQECKCAHISLSLLYVLWLVVYKVGTSSVGGRLGIGGQTYTIVEIENVYESNFVTSAISSDGANVSIIFTPNVLSVLQSLSPYQGMSGIPSVIAYTNNAAQMRSGSLEVDKPKKSLSPIVVEDVGVTVRQLINKPSLLTVKSVCAVIEQRVELMNKLYQHGLRHPRFDILSDLSITHKNQVFYVGFFWAGSEKSMESNDDPNDISFRLVKSLAMEAKIDERKFCQSQEFIAAWKRDSFSLELDNRGRALALSAILQNSSSGEVIHFACAIIRIVDVRHPNIFTDTFASTTISMNDVQFTMGKFLGRGEYCSARQATMSNESGEIEAALKICERGLTLEKEYRIHSLLDGIDGIPKLYGRLSNESDCIRNDEYEMYQMYAMQLLGDSFDKRITATPEYFTPARKASIVFQLVDIFEELTKRNVVHSDLKQENLLFGLGDAFDKIFLIDFGYASIATNNTFSYRELCTFLFMLNLFTEDNPKAPQIVSICTSASNFKSIRANLHKLIDPLIVAV